MLERSQLKKEIFKILLEWDYTKQKASVFNIAKKANCSVSSAQQIVRLWASEGIITSHRGSWVFI
jgi:hypothetical protein